MTHDSNARGAVPSHPTRVAEAQLQSLSAIEQHGIAILRGVQRLRSASLQAIDEPSTHRSFLADWYGLAAALRSFLQSYFGRAFNGVPLPQGFRPPHLLAAAGTVGNNLPRDGEIESTSFAHVAFVYGLRLAAVVRNRCRTEPSLPTMTVTPDGLTGVFTSSDINQFRLRDLKGLAAPCAAEDLPEAFIAIQQFPAWDTPTVKRVEKLISGEVARARMMVSQTIPPPAGSNPSDPSPVPRWVPRYFRGKQYVLLACLFSTTNLESTEADLFKALGYSNPETAADSLGRRATATNQNLLSRADIIQETWQIRESTRSGTKFYYLDRQK